MVYMIIRQHVSFLPGDHRRILGMIFHLPSMSENFEKCDVQQFREKVEIHSSSMTFQTSDFALLSVLLEISQ
jgi:hypothetical protein